MTMKKRTNVTFTPVNMLLMKTDSFRPKLKMTEIKIKSINILFVLIYTSDF